MRDAVVVDAIRTPIGKRNGALSGLHPVDLSAHVLRALTERTRLEPSSVDDVVWGCVSQVGEQTANLGRYAVLAAGWPESVPGSPWTASAAPPNRPFTSRRRVSSPASTTWPWPAASSP